MKKVSDTFEKVQEVMVIIFLIIMACSSFLQVLNRNIFKLSISWTEELSRYCMIWMTMIGTGISVRKGMQMSIDIWSKKVKGVALIIINLFSYLLALGFCGVVMFSITKLMAKQATSHQLSPAMHIPMQYMTVAVFLGMLFLIFVEIEQIVKLFKKEPKTEETEQEAN